MIVSQNKNKDRQIVEDYVKLYCFEEILDEIMNSIIYKLPVNPYQEISQFFLRNTLPEIFKVNISSRIVGSGYFGTYVEVISNYGSFTGMTAPPYDHDNTSLRDYSLIEQRIEDILCPLDPSDIQTIERMLSEMTGSDPSIFDDISTDIDPSITLATSIACLRMSAKFRDVEVFTLISELCGSESVLPLPVTTVLSRVVGPSDQKQHQYFHIYPLLSSNISSCIEILSEFSHRLQRIIAGKHYYDTEEMMKNLAATNIPSPETLDCVDHHIHLSTLWNGSLSVRGMSLSQCLKLLTTALEEDGEIMKVKPSIDLRGSHFVHITNPSSDRPSMSYSYFNKSSATSMEAAETLLMLWKEYEMVSLEDIFHPRDRLAYHHFKTSIQETISSLKRDEAARELAYAQRGIGLDESCHLQMVIDHLCRTREDLMDIYRDYPAGSINTVKVRLEKFSTISQAIAFCQAIQGIKWNIQVGCSEDSPETTDTFVTDFAVGVGAHQLLGGGLFSAEYSCKYNRLIEIQEMSGGRINFVGSKFRKKY